LPEVESRFAFRADQVLKYRLCSEQCLDEFTSATPPSADLARMAGSRQLSRAHIHSLPNAGTPFTGRVLTLTKTIRLERRIGVQ
jgi:hypothetical protein